MKDQVKTTVIIGFVMAVLVVPMFRLTRTTSAEPLFGDVAATYKGKCAMCHTANASKYFDANKADADLVQIILKGKKGEKPPFMPEYETKGITEADAQALVTYMKGLRVPAN